MDPTDSRPTAVPGPARRLTRPTTTRRRWSGRIARLRIRWRRLTASVAVGLAAAALTILALSSLTDDSIVEQLEPVTEVSTTDADATGPAGKQDDEVGGRTLEADQRIVALDRSAVALPVSLGAEVEVVGLRPTVTDMETEVISPRAEVIGVTDDVILLVMHVDAAHRAGEIDAIGSLTLFGLTGIN